MRPPEFWLTGGWQAKALSPLSALYAAGSAVRRAAASPYRAPVPVICVGNLTVGGSGKTPATQAVVRALRTRGLTPHIQIKGYGGRLRGPILVDAKGHLAADVGDEALLHAEVAPTWMAKSRRAGVAAAVRGGADIIVMDDGHQNPTVQKDVSIVVVDGLTGFGNGYVVPAGPLRETVGAGLERANAVILVGQDHTSVLGRLPAGLPVLKTTLEPDAETRGLKGRRVVAFAGLGNPIRFFESLAALGARVVAVHPFEDHYQFGEADIQPILDEAFQLGAVPVTTAKDAARLSPDQRQQVNVARVRLNWDTPKQLDDIFGPVVSG